jgi:hypothetical protein
MMTLVICKLLCPRGCNRELVLDTMWFGLDIYSAVAFIMKNGSAYIFVDGLLRFKVRFLNFLRANLVSF